MSEQFRLTVRQLFSSRLLFVAQAQATFHGGKRYSLILVDVDSLPSLQSNKNTLSTNHLFKTRKSAPEIVEASPLLKKRQQNNSFINKRTFTELFNK